MQIERLRQTARRDIQIHGLPNHVGALRFSQHDVECIATVFNSMQLAQGLVVPELPPGPLAPPDGICRELEQLSTTLGPGCEDTGFEVPFWARIMCRAPYHWHRVAVLMFACAFG